MAGAPLPAPAPRNLIWYARCPSVRRGARAAPYCVRWVRRFLTRAASDEPLADQVRAFCEELERSGDCQDWQVRQAEQALRIYFANFLQRTDWHRQSGSAVVDEQGRTDPLAALQGAFPICSTRGWTKGSDFGSLRVPRRHPWATARGISLVSRSVAKTWI